MLLQINDYQLPHESIWENPLIYFGVPIGLVIYVVIIRAVFSINTITKQLEAQTQLLEKIAKSMGVEREAVDEIVND